MTCTTNNCEEVISIKNPHPKESSELISQLMDLHSVICDLADSIQQYFGYTLTFIFIIKTVELVLDSYFFFDILFIPEDYEKKFLAVVIPPTILACIMLVGIVEICEKTTSKNKDILKNILKLSNFDVSGEMKERLQFFILQSSKRSIEFSGAGIFSVNRKMYLTVSD